MKLRGPQQYYFDAISLHRHNKKLLINLMDTVVCHLSFISNYGAHIRGGEAIKNYIPREYTFPVRSRNQILHAHVVRDIILQQICFTFFLKLIQSVSNPPGSRRGLAPLLISDPSFFPDHRLKPLTLSETISCFAWNRDERVSVRRGR